MGFFVAARALGELTFEATSLLLRIVEFAEGVADLQTPDKDLETFDPVRVFLRLSLVFRQRLDG